MASTLVEHKYVVELARTVEAMFADGKNDPTAEEIAEHHFSGRTLGGEIVDGVRKRLKKIKRILEEDFKRPVYLLSRTYYIRFRDELPQTAAEAKLCVPVGQGVIALGLRLHTSADDLIYEAMLDQNSAAGAGKLKKSIDRTLEAVEDKRMLAPRAAQILSSARRRAEPGKPALAARVMKALPKKGGR